MSDEEIKEYIKVCIDTYYRNIFNVYTDEEKKAIIYEQFKKLKTVDYIKSNYNMIKEISSNEENEIINQKLKKLELLINELERFKIYVDIVDYKDILKLKYIKGLDNKEIQKITQIEDVSQKIKKILDELIVAYLFY